MYFLGISFIKFNANKCGVKSHNIFFQITFIEYTETKSKDFFHEMLIMISTFHAKLVGSLLGS